MPASYPGIKFDSDGVCNICQDFDRRRQKPQAGIAGLHKMLAWSHRRNPDYNVVLGNSGGADSSYLIHLFATQLGARILSYTCDNGFLAPIARHNIDRLNSRLGIQHIYVNTDSDLIIRMYRALVLNGSYDFCSICINAIYTAGCMLAVEHKIPLVAWGLSTQTEPIFPVTVVNSGDYRFLKSVVHPGVSESEFAQFRYLSPLSTARSLFLRRIRHILLPDYVSWDRNQFIPMLTGQYGWQDAPKSKPHFDCLIGELVDYFWLRRFGFSKNAAFISFAIRNGSMSREEGMERIAAEMALGEPVEKINAFCKTLGLEPDDLRHVLDGTSHDCYHFHGYHRWMKRCSRLFWLLAELKVLPPAVYQKYR